MSERKTLYRIGETYRNRDLHKGVAVIRPAVLEGATGASPRVITTSPCCPLQTRRLKLDDLNSSLAEEQGGWNEKCGCGAYYLVSPKYSGRTVFLGLYGARWVVGGV